MTRSTEQPVPGNDHPFFSVALPAYNAEATLPRAIESVIAQTDGDWELVVVDDGSSDRTGDVARSFAARDKRIRVVSQSNAGPGAARDAAVRASSAPWIVRLDADDELLPSFLSRMRAVIGEHPCFDIFSPTGIERRQGGDERVWCPNPKYEQAFELGFDDTLHGWCPVFTQSVFSRELWERIGGHRSEVYSDDWDFWARALASGARGWFTPEALSIYHLGTPGHLSGNTTRLAESALDSLIFIERSCELSTEEHEALVRRIAGLRRRVEFRHAAQRLLGDATAERVVTWLTGMVQRTRTAIGPRDASRR